MKPVRCKYYGARLERDVVGLYCPTKNCQWAFGIPDEEEYKPKPPLTNEAAEILAKCFPKPRDK